jgi:hypothetical protein
MTATTAQHEVQYAAARELDRLVGAVQTPDAADVDWLAVMRRAETLIELARRGMHAAAMNPDRLVRVAAVARTAAGGEK